MSNIKVEAGSSQLMCSGGPVKFEPQEDAVVVTQNGSVPVEVKKEEPLEDAIEVIMDDGSETENDQDQSDGEVISDGDDLRADIEAALVQLDFQGTYALSHTYRESPNPWLHVEGVGLVGLPLTEASANPGNATVLQSTTKKGPNYTQRDLATRFGWCLKTRDCNVLDTFLLSSESTCNFRRAQSARTHIEARIRHATDLVSYSTIRSGIPHTLQVQKKPEVISACTWAGRQLAAKEFLLGTFGGAIQQLMENYYDDVVKAVNGEQPFAWSNDYLVQVRAAAATPQTSSSASSSTLGQAAAGGSSPQILAGMKRKLSSM
ncbi:hypothetical protein BDN72DRAFT_962735 [Pluteus cervinus]|uniref:Uncharacterized protein n=1 Tax=Pluteus cervinus TaxID=181527 RepID=A0ACD3AGU9_9AGAR|nr:hypothetical protein BDN72DRAFT_962735 [Pluteus cervinus]